MTQEVPAIDPLAIVTPTYSVDYDVFTRLRRSVQRFAPPGSVHYLIVPQEDVPLFAKFAGPDCVVWSTRELLAPTIRATPRLSRVSDLLPRVPASARVVALSPRRPWWPIRGWILQQALKLSAAERLGASTVLVVDSDVELIRPVRVAAFQRAGRTVLYRRDDAVTSALPDHVRWHLVARKLLGVPAAEPPFHDYISAFIALDAGVVRQLRAFLEARHGACWQEIITRQSQISEWTLYGVFADEVLGWKGLPQAHRASSLCHEHWGTAPMGAADVPEFVGACPDEDLAMMISAKSRTPMAVRQQVSERLAPSVD